MDGAKEGDLDEFCFDGGIGDGIPAGFMLDEISRACEESSLSAEEPTVVGDGPGGTEFPVEEDKLDEDEVSFRASGTVSDLLFQCFGLPAFAGPVCSALALFFVWLMSFRLLEDRIPGLSLVFVTSLLVSVGAVMLLSLAVFSFPFSKKGVGYDFSWFGVGVAFLVAGSVCRFAWGDDGLVRYVVMRSLSACFFGVSVAWNAHGLYSFCRDVAGMAECEMSSWDSAAVILCQTMTFLLVFKVFFGVFALTSGFNVFSLPEVISFFPRGCD